MTSFLLRVEDLAKIVGIAATFFGVSFGAFAACVKEEKRRAWFLSLVTAAIVSPRSGFPDYPFKGYEMLRSDRAADLTVGIFVAFLLTDTLAGAIFYRSSFHLVEGWLHHCFYLIFFLYAFTRGLTVAAATTFILEVPTLVLAIGHCFPRARMDLLFGLTFFLFRILYHSYLLYNWATKARAAFVPIIAATLALHAHWFSKWLKSQSRRRRQPRKTQHSLATTTTT